MQSCKQLQWLSWLERRSSKREILCSSDRKCTFMAFKSQIFFDQSRIHADKMFKFSNFRLLKSTTVYV